MSDSDDPGDGAAGSGHSDRPNDESARASVRGPLLVLAYVSIVSILAVTNVLDGPLRIVLVAPILVFVPGYALLFALFPRTAPYGDVLGGAPGPRLAWIERGAVAVALSVVVLVLLVLALGGFGVPLATAPITLAIFLVTVFGLGVGTIRRANRPGSGGLVPLDRWRTEFADATVGAESGVDAALTLVLLLVVVLALTGLVYGLAAPDRSPSYTEVALLDRQGDALTASDYPTNVTRGSPVEVALTVENREGVPMEYTVLIAIERVRTTGDDAAVLERATLERRTLAVDDGATRTEDLSPRPELLGTDLRLSVYVVEGDPPDRIDAATADHHLYLWLDVEAPTGNQTARSGALSSVPRTGTLSTLEPLVSQ